MQIFFYKIHHCFVNHAPVFSAKQVNFLLLAHRIQTTDVRLVDPNQTTPGMSMELLVHMNAIQDIFKMGALVFLAQTLCAVKIKELSIAHLLMTLHAPVVYKM